MSVKDWADAMERAGHAPIFVSPTKSLEPIVEKQTAEEFAKALSSEFGIELGDIRNAENPNNDFPDCFCRHKGKTANIELTELVRGHLRGNTSVRWRDKQWSEEQFSRGIERLIEKKIAKSYRHQVQLDYLVIYSNEEWISPFQAKEWLSSNAFSASGRIRSAYFLQFYVPGWRDHWPLHKITLNNPA